MIRSRLSEGEIFLLTGILFFGGALLPVLYMLINGIVSILNPHAISQLLSEKARHWQLLKNSLFISLGTAIGSVLLGAPLAFVIQRVSFPGRGIFALLLPLPLFIPPYVAALSWMHLLGPSGWLNQVLPGASWLLNDGHSLFGSMCVMILSYHPIVALSALTGFSQMDADLEDAARLQVRPWRALRLITLRLALPAILAGGLLVFMLALSNFGVPSLLQVQVYSIEVFYRFSILQQMDQATIYALPLLCLSFLALSGIYLLERRPHATISSSRRPPCLLAPGPWRWVMTALVVCLFLVSVALPLKALFDMAGPFDNYLAALANARQDVLTSLQSSVLAACGAAAVVATIVFSAWGMSSTRVAPWLERMAFLSYAFPAAVVGIGIISLYNREGPIGAIYSSSFVLILAFFCRYISLAFKPAMTATTYLDPSLNESARAMGVAWWRRALRIFMPLTARGMVVGWFLVYLFSLTDLDTAILVHPPGRATLPVRVFNLLHFGRHEWVGALCLVLVALATAPYIMFMLWGEKGVRTDS